MNNNIPLVPEHIDDKRLIAFLDAEMDEASRREAQGHLDMCWDCRIRLTNVERSIENFFEFRSRELLPPPSDISPIGPAQDLLRAQIIAYQSLTPAQTFFNGHLPGIRSLSRRIMKLFDVRAYSLRMQVMLARGLAAVLVGSLAVMFVLMSGRLTTVSANELLDRSINAQTEAINVIAQPVLHQKIVVRTGSGSDWVNWEIWNDTVNSRVKLQSSTPYEGGADAASADGGVSDLRAILRANRMNEHRPLSAASYKSWSDSISRKTENVEISQDVLTIHTVTTQVAYNKLITEARFSVRGSDYHPTALYIKTASHEFELVEQAYEIVSLKEVDPAIFADPTKVEVASTVGTQSVPPAVAGGDIPEANVNANTNAGVLANMPSATSADEVEVLDLLHQVGADITEQINVTRTADGRLLVEGLVETDARKQEILRALSPVRNNPALRIKVQTIGEAARALQNQKQQSAPGMVERVEVEKAPLAIDAELRQYFERRGGDLDEQIRGFASRVISRSKRAAFQASALNRMANRFNAKQLSDLAPEARAKWLNILKGYAAAVRRETAALRGELQPVFGGMDSGGGESITDDADLIASARHLYNLASTNDGVIRSAFTLTSGGTSISAVKSAQFRGSLAQAEAVAAAIEHAR